VKTYNERFIWWVAGVLAAQLLLGCADAEIPLDEPSVLQEAVVPMHPLGARKDPAARVASKRAAAAEPAALPSHVDLSDRISPPGDQQSEGSCVGWAVGYATKTFDEAAEETWSPVPTNHRFSPSWVYNQINGGEDDGAYISDALDLIVDSGADTLDAFPYVNGDVTTTPDDASLARAARFKARSWSTLDVSESQFKSVLAQGNPVVIGLEVYPDFDNLNGTTNTVYDSDVGSSRGRHALAIIGYDDARGAFRFINSWGTGWGNGGYGWISYSFITNENVDMEAYVLIDDANQHLFSASSWAPSLNDANGFDAPQYPVAYADVDGDGRDDVCARGTAGVSCARSNGTSFPGLSLWSSNFSDANGWNLPRYYDTIQYPDVNGDGRADLCGRGGAGIYCAISTGSSFTNLSLWASTFSNANGWSLEQAYSTLAYPDLNGDGKADVCGRGSDGIICALSNGSSFSATSVWESHFSDAGWTLPEYYSTIRFADINHDGRDDLCARGAAGIVCATSTGSSFTGLKTWQAGFSDANHWNQERYYRTIAFQDVNGDRRADVCGRGVAGVLCALSDGVSFSAVSLWQDNFSDANGWGAPQYYETVQFPDVNRDGKADLCGRGVAGLYCAISDGGHFKNLSLWDASLSNAAGWDQPVYYRSIKFADAAHDLFKRLCYRGSLGVYCR
jgi:C1A family cysteine protease